MSTEAADKLTITCDGCQKKLRVPAKAAGKRVKCPKCEAVIRVPAAPTEAEPSPLMSEEEDLLSGLADAERAAAPVSPADLGGDPSAPAPRSLEEQMAGRMKATRHEASETSKNSAMTRTWGAWIVSLGSALFGASIVSRITLVAVVLGGVFIFVGYNEQNLKSRALDEPQDLTCEELAAAGPGDNYHIRLSDYVLLPDYVYMQSFRLPSKAWIPAISLRDYHRGLATALQVEPHELGNLNERRLEEAAAQLSPADFAFRVIICLPDISGPEEVEAFDVEEVVQGTIMEYVNDDTRRILKESYPNANIDNCWLLVKGRKPFGKAYIAKAYGGGGLLIIIGLAIAIRRASTDNG